MVWRVLGGVLVACGMAVPAHAHHSFAAEFEADKTAELSGKIEGWMTEWEEVEKELEGDS